VGLGVIVEGANAVGVLHRLQTVETAGAGNAGRPVEEGSLSRTGLLGLGGLLVGLSQTGHVGRGSLQVLVGEDQSVSVADPDRGFALLFVENVKLFVTALDAGGAVEHGLSAVADGHGVGLLLYLLLNGLKCVVSSLNNVGKSLEGVCVREGGRLVAAVVGEEDELTLGAANATVLTKDWLVIGTSNGGVDIGADRSIQTGDRRVTDFDVY